MLVGWMWFWLKQGLTSVYTMLLTNVVCLKMIFTKLRR